MTVRQLFNVYRSIGLSAEAAFVLALAKGR